MPQFNYRGRDKEGLLRVGQREAPSVDKLNQLLIKEGIYPISIQQIIEKTSFTETVKGLLQGKALVLEELAIFARQMQLLQKANVPMVNSLQQLKTYTRSYQLKKALEKVIEDLEKGQSLSSAMENHPTVFTPLVVNLVQIGESTGDLTGTFENLHHYLSFELNNHKQLKAAFRYPIFVLITVGLAILILNVFVIPTFAKFYVQAGISLPWQTRFLIASSNFFVHDGIYALIGLIGLFLLFNHYIHTPKGKYRWDYFLLSVPVTGKLLRRLLLIRFSQTLSITINAGLSITKSLELVKKLLHNNFISTEITRMQEAIERGTTFTESIKAISLLSPLEMQIVAVGEKNGELSPAMDFIASFHAQEIEFDLKRLNDVIGPTLIGIISVLVLIMALGIYLPIWNMVNLVNG